MQPHSFQSEHYPQLQGRNILVGVSGGIAAYKTPELVRRLRDCGAIVRVVMTTGAKAFITPLTLQAVSGHVVNDDLLDPAAEAAMGHIELAKWANLILVAPASANTLARLAHGLADDLLSTLCLASSAPIAIAPAMNQQMWQAPAVQANLATLQQFGIHNLGTGSGAQACGDVGAGRMLEPLELVAACQQLLSTLAHDQQTLAGKHIVITAGPTREAIDPVRYLSNHSSGKMGFALAAQAAALGAQVTLVAGPCQLATPTGVQRIDIESASQMLDAVMAHIGTADVFMGCAAVADYRVAEVAPQKLKKRGDAALQLTLTQNPDIVATVAALPQPPIVVGFAAETQAVADYAQAKLIRKRLHMIAANDVSDSSIGFNQDDNAMQVFWRTDLSSEQLHSKQLPKQAKTQLAKQLLALIQSELLHS